MTTDRCTTSGGEWTPPYQLLELATVDETLLPELVSTFQKDSTLRLGQIRAAAAAGETGRLCSEAHTIKGSARQMGAGAVADVCLEIEENLADLSGSELAQRMNLLESRLSEICYAMSRYLASA